MNPRAGGKHLAEREVPERRRWVVLASLAVVLVAAVALALFAGADDEPATVTGDADATSTTPAPTGPDAVEPVGPSSTASPLAEPTDPRGNGETITIVFAGDMYAEGVLADRLARDPAGFVGPFAPVIAEADLAVGNLETAITERGAPPPGKQFAFRAPASVLDALRAGGFDVVSLANNHGVDFGPEGLEDSVAAKRATGDDFVIGIGLDEDEAYAPHSVAVKGQRVAVIGATQVLDDSLISAWTAGPDKPGLASAKRVDRLVAEVAAARATHDTVVVYLHWGIETHECPAPRQIELAAALREAGADVVVGGHAHRVQGGGLLDGAVVHYGLGNFLFKENSAPGARTGVLRVAITGRVVESYEWIPGRVVDSVPRPLEGADAAAELAAWQAQRGCTGLSA